MLKKSLLVASLAALSLAGLAYGQQAPLQPSLIKRTPLGKVEVPGSNYEVVFGIAELAAGHKAGRHSHPGPLLVYVTEGQFWYHIDGQPEKVYKAGEFFPSTGSRDSRRRRCRKQLRQGDGCLYCREGQTIGAAGAVASQQAMRADGQQLLGHGGGADNLGRLLHAKSSAVYARNCVTGNDGSASGSCIRD